MSAQSDALLAAILKRLGDNLERERTHLERDTDRTLYALAVRKGKVQAHKADMLAVQEIFKDIDAIYERGM